jgi:arginyl-tRNA synthetase
MNIFSDLKHQINHIVLQLYNIDFNQIQFSVELPKNHNHGDLSTNIAMVLAKNLKQSPFTIAEEIKDKIQQIDYINEVKILTPGFINITIKINWWHNLLSKILEEKDNYGNNNIGNGCSMNLEFVSTNPTGPMHIGHSRGGIYGDALARLMSKCGYKVTKEFYINDAGAQITALAQSAYLRYLEACGETVVFTDGMYPGEYLIPVGQELLKKYGHNLKDMSLVKEFVVSSMMELIKADLEKLGVTYDVFFSEKTLHEQGKIDEVIKELQAKDLVYKGVLQAPKGKKPQDWEEREQLLFRTTLFGDDVDRPLQKSNGDWTYAAADIAYMKNKIDRGFSKITLVLGADHLGYKKRMQAAALSLGEVDFDIKFYQVVNFFQDGQPYKMSKRQGNFITVEDVLQEVGKDLVRFVMLTRKNDQILDFDFEKVKEQSKDNPVFYVQYANARVNSILNNANQRNPEYFNKINNREYDLSALSNPEDIELIRLMSSWPQVVEAACIQQEPHRIAFFLIELASLFHSLWSKGNDNPQLKFIIPNDFKQTLARLVLAKAVSIVISSGLKIFNISPIEKM